MNRWLVLTMAAACLAGGLSGCNDGVLVAGGSGSGRGGATGDDCDKGGDDDDDCGGSGDGGAGGVSFKNDIYPSFEEDICTVCHGGDEAYAGMELDKDCNGVYDELTVEDRVNQDFGSGPRIQESDVGFAEESFFVFFSQETSPPPMDHLQWYIDWINDGFPNDCDD